MQRAKANPEANANPDRSYDFVHHIFGSSG